MKSSEESKIFKKENILSFEYLPEVLPHREAQIKQMADNLLPASGGRKPQNTFIHGGPGIGKTAVAKFVFREFENYSGIKTIYLNCWDFNTTISILSEITIQLGMVVGRRGWGKDEILSKLIEVLKKSKRSLVVCLDEVDQLVRKDPDVLYDLSRINQYVNNPVGLVLISNDHFVFSRIEPRIRSSLSIEEIEFKPYSIGEMKDILQRRSDGAFRSIESGVIALAANHAVNKGSDVRSGLECLLKAGRIAEQENAEKVKVEHVKKILKDVIKTKPQILKKNINEVERAILTILEENNELPFGELYKKYCEIERNCVTEKPFLNYVKHLDELKLIKFKKRKVNGKRIISKV
jgi:archaeal cell division control protein 6